MNEKAIQIVKYLTENNQTIATMESCTGGALVNEITNVEGANGILKFCAITYCNEYKIKFGVKENIINTYTVYSIQTAMDMAKVISNYTQADYGVGITGKLNKSDKNNLTGPDDIVFISIYNRNNDLYYNKEIKVGEDMRVKNKEFVVEQVLDLILEIIE